MNKNIIQFYIDGSHNQRNQSLLIYGIMMSEEHGECYLIDKKSSREFKTEFNIRHNSINFGCTDSEIYSFYMLVKLLKENKEKFKNKSIQIFTDSEQVQLLFFGDTIPKVNNKKMNVIYSKIVGILSELNNIDIELFHINGHRDCWGNLEIDRKITKWLRRFNLNYTNKNNSSDLTYDTLNIRLNSIYF